MTAESNSGIGERLLRSIIVANLADSPDGSDLVSSSSLSLVGLFVVDRLLWHHFDRADLGLGLHLGLIA